MAKVVENQGGRRRECGGLGCGRLGVRQASGRAHEGLSSVEDDAGGRKWAR